MLLSYRVHRLGIADAVEAAQAAVGTAGNPVTGLAVQGNQLVVTFEDGSTDVLDLPAGGMGGDDQVARDAAAAAQSDITDHEASTHNTDQTARDSAAAAQTDITDHEAPTHNHDQVARDAAAAAQSDADAAGSTASAASGAASTAQATADTNRGNLTDHEADANAHHTPPTGGGGGGTDDQTAAEVSVDATQFSAPGNLGSTDTDVQAALETIHGLELGSGGDGGGGDAPDRIVLADAVAVAATTSPSPIALTEDVVARNCSPFAWRIVQLLIPARPS